MRPAIGGICRALYPEARRACFLPSLASSQEHVCIEGCCCREEALLAWTEAASGASNAGDTNITRHTSGVPDKGAVAE